MADEWKMKRAGKERTKGVRVRRVLTCAGEFLSFFVFFSLSSCYCISSLFFIEGEVNDDTWRKEHFLGKNSSLSFFETGFEYRGIGAWGSFVSIKIESSLLFFWIAETCDNTTSLEHPFAMLSLSWHSALMRSIEETLIGEVRWFLIEINHWKYHKVFKFHMRIFARRCLGANASSNLNEVKYQLFEACSWDDDWNTRAEILNREHRGGRYSE